MSDKKAAEKDLKNSPEKIIIKANLQNYTFPKESYVENYLGHLILKKEFDTIIDNSSKILSQAWMKKRENDKINLPPFVTILSVISVLLTIVYMIMIYYSTTIEDGTALLVVSVICVVIATAIAFGLSIYNFCRKMGTFKTVQEIIKEDLYELYSYENQLYQNKLQFVFNDEGNYLEVKILQVKQGLEFNKEQEDNQEGNQNLDFGEDKQNNSVKNSRQISQKGSRPHSRQASEKKNQDLEMVKLK
jgi:hypothetical protein